MVRSMAFIHVVVFLILFNLGIIQAEKSSRVLELSDRFIEVSKNGMWLVMFYAPWCGHCKKLDPVWNQVAQSLFPTPVKVGRVDCTRFSSVATEFGVKGFPTILFMKDRELFSYSGDRVREDIVDFAIRLSGPSVRELTKYEEFVQLKQKHKVFFMYVGLEDDLDLWPYYEHVAQSYITTNYFYKAVPSILKDEIPDVQWPQILAVKDEMYHVFEGIDPEMLNVTLREWVNKERFILFQKITHGNFNQILLTEKYIALAVLEENKVGSLTADMKKFKSMLYSVAVDNKDEFYHVIQFGWTGHPDIANSVAMETLPIPSLLVINSVTYQHYIPEDEPTQLTEEVMVAFLEQVVNQTVQAYGGNSLIVRMYRLYYEVKTSLADMWHGNPVLTAVLFGMPMGFLSLICYSICCADIMEATEEQEMMERERRHAKKE